VVAVAALATSTLVPPAHAAPGDAVLSYAPTAIVKENSCVDHAFTYAVELPEGTTNWTLAVELIGPDGETHTRQLVGAFASDPPSGSEALQLCALFEPVGTYQIFKTVDYKVGTNSTVFGPRTLDGTFQVVRDAKSKVALKAKRKGARIISTATVSVSTGGDYGPVAAGGPVVFQKQVGKSWKTVDKAVTDATGKAKGKFRSKGTTRVRAVFRGMGEVLVGSGLPVPPATSKVVRVR
jgi:hypothetical protein